MATVKRKRTVENFKGVYDGIVMPEFKNINVELLSSFEKIVWTHSGVVDSFRPYFKINFNVKNNSFSNLLSKDVAGVLGWKGIPFNQVEKTFFVEKKWGDLNEQKELLLKIIERFKEIDDKIDLVSEKSPEGFDDAAQKYNGSVETENFIVEYDTEKKRAYVVLKNKESVDYMTLRRAGVPPYSELMGDDINTEALEHKVKDIPGYKNKDYLKNYVRSKCFCIPAINYSMVDEVIRLQVSVFNERKNKVEKWLEDPKNQERLNNVLIRDSNPYKLVVDYDKRKKAIIFSCPLFAVTVFEDKVTNKRKTTMDMLFFNEVLCRNKRESDDVFNASSSEHSMSLKEDRANTWNHEGVERHKFVFNKRPDSKGQMIYLEIKDNIEELESLKANYNNFIENYEKKFTTVEIPKFLENPKDVIDDYYPTIYLEEETHKAYMIYDVKSVLKEDGLSYSWVSDKTIEIDSAFALDLLNKGRDVVYKTMTSTEKFAYHVYTNALNLKTYKDGVNGTLPTIELSNLYMKKFEIAWDMARVMKQYTPNITGMNLDSNNDTENGPSSMFGFKI